MQEEGIVLLFTLIMIVIVSVVAVSLLEIVGKENITAVSYQHKLENEYLMQAAVAVAEQKIKKELAVNDNWITYDLNKINCWGTLESKDLLDNETLRVNYKLQKIRDELGKININYCSELQLSALSEVGIDLAAKIKQQRVEKVFTASEELKSIKGIGDGKYKGLEPFVRTAAAGEININTASEQVLQTLKNIGPFTAAEIITYRQTESGFEKKEELKNITGIGEITYQQLENQITVDSDLVAVALEISIPTRDFKQEVRTVIELN